MLSITRRPGETIRIGDDIQIQIVSVKGNSIRLGITAPRDVTINREEVYQRIAEANSIAAQVATDIAGALAAFTPDATAPATSEAAGAVAEAVEE